MADEHSKEHRFIYSTHKEALHAPAARVTAAQLKEVIGKHVEGFNAADTLVLEERGDHPDRPLQDTDEVHVEDTPHFYSQPPANFGS